MAKKLSGMVIFSCEKYGLDKEEVGRHFAEIYFEYEKLYIENTQLKKRIKALKEKIQTQ